MTTDVLAPLGATPFAGLVPRLVAFWRTLRAAVARHSTTDEQEQMFHLVALMVNYFGKPLLSARSLDDLDDQIDKLASSPQALYINVLMMRHMEQSPHDDSMSTELFAEAVAETLGLAQAAMLAEVAVELDAWASAQQQAIALVGAPGPEVDHQIFEFSLSNPDLPPDIANAIFHSLRAGFCMTAMAHVIAEEQDVEPWLSRALTERLVESIREHLRLLASLPGVSVGTSIVPLAARLDLVAIEARHQRARLTAHRTYVQTRALLGS